MSTVIAFSPAAPQDAVGRFEAARREAARAKRRRDALSAVLLAAAVVGSGVVAEVSPARFAEGLPNALDYAGRTLPPLGLASLPHDLAEWFWGWRKWLALLFDTVVMAFLGTLLGAAGGFLLSFPASRNLVAGRWLYFATRRLLELARAVPELVYALIFVFAFGLGPLPGVLAIAVHTFGALGKLFAEANENVDSRPIEGVRAAGGNWFQVMRYAVVPQVLPNFASYALLRFEINVRSAAILGFVGAGGIGIELYTVIRQFIYTDISALVLLIVATVALIDMACERLRHQLIGRENLV
jgi:phosphonate transport system permease protein